MLKENYDVSALLQVLKDYRTVAVQLLSCFPYSVRWLLAMRFGLSGKHAISVWFVVLPCLAPTMNNNIDCQVVMIVSLTLGLHCRSVCLIQFYQNF